MPVATLRAPCIINHEGVVCCGDRMGFAGASLFTAMVPVHCSGYQILRPHFQTCGPNIEKVMEENFVQRLKARPRAHKCVGSARSAVNDALAPSPPPLSHVTGQVRSSGEEHRVASVQELADEAVPFEGRPCCCQGQCGSALMLMTDRANGFINDTDVIDTIASNWDVLVVANAAMLSPTITPGDASAVAVIAQCATRR